MRSTRLKPKCKKNWVLECENGLQYPPHGRRSRKEGTRQEELAGGADKKEQGRRNWQAELSRRNWQKEPARRSE